MHLYFCSTYPRNPLVRQLKGALPSAGSDWHALLLHIPEVEKAFYLSWPLHVDNVFFIKICMLTQLIHQTYFLPFLS